MAQSRSKKMEARFDLIEARMEEMFKALQDLRNERESPRNRSSPSSGTPIRGTVEQWRKLELPIFCGDDASIWIERMEQFFLLRAVPEEEWLSVATYAMEGRAFTWFRWWEATAPILQWQSFSSALLRHFQPARLQSPYETLLKLRQTSSVRDFVDQFVLHARPLRGLAPELLRDLFLNGLKLEVSEECKLFSFHSVDELMELAQKVENRNVALRGAAFKGEGKPPNFNSAASETGGAAMVGNSEQSNNLGESKGTVSIMEPPKQRGMRHLSNEAYKAKLAKGECFMCDEPYSADHVCKNKEFKLMLVEPEFKAEWLHHEAVAETEYFSRFPP